MMMESLKGLGAEEDAAEEEIEQFIFNQDSFRPEAERNAKAKKVNPGLDGL